jgi:predicted metal-binding protein
MIPYLRPEFIASLDRLQRTLMIESKIYQKKMPCYKIFEDIDEFKKYIKRNNPSLLMRTKDDDEMEEILIDIIQSEKIQDYKVNLTKSHLKTFQTLLQQ